MSAHHHINYIEFAAKDLSATKTFFIKVFNWQFTDYGPEYSAFANSGIAGGFYQAPLAADTAKGSPLIVIYSDALESTLQDVLDAGGIIVKDIFSFPGGRRFHFTEPSGNELAVWSE